MAEIQERRDIAVAITLNEMHNMHFPPPPIPPRPTRTLVPPMSRIRHPAPNAIVVPKPLVLRAAPMVPNIPPSLPNTLVELLQQHYDNKLDTLDDSYKGHWPLSVRNRFSKRKNLFEHITAKAKRIRSDESMIQKTILAATALDAERNNLQLTVNQYAVNVLPKKTRQPRQAQPQAQPQAQTQVQPQVQPQARQRQQQQTLDDYRYVDPNNAWL